MEIKCENCDKIFKVAQCTYYYSPYIKCPHCGENPYNKRYSPFDDTIRLHQSIAGHK